MRVIETTKSSEARHLPGTQPRQPQAAGASHRSRPSSTGARVRAAIDPRCWDEFYSEHKNSQACAVQNRTRARAIPRADNATQGVEKVEVS
jgi:hypothetical protein